MRILLDTNVLAIGMAEYVWGLERHPAFIWRRWQAKEFDLLISAHLLHELDQALRTSWFTERLTPVDMLEFHADLRRNAIFVEITQEVHGIASHWQDDLVLAAAVSGNADFLVTRDKEFRQVVEYSAVRIRTPAEFLMELDAVIESE